MSAMITPILNSLTDFSNFTTRLPRDVALQPSIDNSSNLDLGRFLSPTPNS